MAVVQQGGQAACKTSKEGKSLCNKNGTPIKCWYCRGNHLVQECLKLTEAKRAEVVRKKHAKFRMARKEKERGKTSAETVPGLEHAQIDTHDIKGQGWY